MATPRAILASVRTAAARPRVAASAAPRFPSPSASFARGLASAVEQRPAKQWTRDEIQEVYDTPLMELIFRAATVHRLNHPPDQVQLCTLLNIKTGGCSEDCSYCAQSSRHADKVGLKAEKLTDVETVLVEARKAKANGSTRFCMGAAWRDMSGRKRGFERILKMVEGVRALDMEVCTTLGMLTPEQAAQLKQAGLTAYNHNLDTSREYYPKVITTRKFDERLDTIEAVRSAGISVCSGGIIGLGENDGDRVGLIWEMSQLPEAPESFPVNALVAIPGTPLEKNERVTVQELLRTIATARIVLPTSIIRFAAGRISYTETEQAMAFMAGANAVFTGERMLTTPTSGWDEDHAMLARWGLKGMGSFESTTVRMKENQKALEATEERKAAAASTTAEASASA
ncbi:biotin synthase, BioB [Rhodotorula diobovata]|uniref:biotin synthase n=1 Tax=Rhodotorula diobovata TaxID=5288 RepID=A0A5C5G2K9_9BASI|nr:biotin synthase, BioB [Rhodotorula diobovata]